MSATIDPDTAPGDSRRDDPPAPGEVAAPHRFRRWPWLIAVVALVAASAVAAIAAGTDGSSDSGEGATTANFAEVVRTDLVEIESYDATLGTVAGDPITTQRSGTLTSVIAAGDTAAAGDVIYTVDGEPVVLLYGETPAWRSIAPTEDPGTLVNRLSGTVTDVVEAGTVLEQGDVAYWVDGEPVVIVYGAVPAYRTMDDARTNLDGDDILQLETFLDESGFDDIGIAVDGEFTSATESVVENWQEEIGATVDGVVQLGEVVFVDGPLDVASVDIDVGDTVTTGAPVLTYAGDTPTTGTDVQQLEENLAALGHDAGGELVVDGVFDGATAAAIEAWQADVAVEVDGIVDLGEVVFVPGPIRVGGTLAAPGAAVNPGAGVLAVSAADKVVTLELPAEDQGLLVIGDVVVVELPDGTDVPGTVEEIATVATADLQGNAVFEITIALDDADVAADLDEAPVDVEVVTDSVENVVAVPVTALLALAEGGYAVEVETAAGTRLVAVDPGFFADGLVEVTTDELAPGDRVVVP